MARYLKIDHNKVINGIHIELDIAHRSPLDLAFVLQAPTGERFVFEQPGFNNASYRIYELIQFNGMSTRGYWRIEFYDLYQYDVGQISRIKVSFK